MMMKLNAKVGDYILYGKEGDKLWDHYKITTPAVGVITEVHDNIPEKMRGIWPVVYKVDTIQEGTAELYIPGIELPESQNGDFIRFDFDRKDGFVIADDNLHAMIGNPKGKAVVIPRFSYEIGETLTSSNGKLEMLVAHIDKENRYVYLIQKYHMRNVTFGIASNPSEWNAVLRDECIDWMNQYNDELTEFIGGNNLMVPPEGHGCPAFIPTFEQVTSGTKVYGSYHGDGQWSYFKDDESRKFQKKSGKPRCWWLQTPDYHPAPGLPTYLHCVVVDGDVYSYNPKDDRIGFRPAICIQIPEFIK